MNTHSHHVETGFRRWMSLIRTGDGPLWPKLLGAALDEEFDRTRDSTGAYTGEVFKDRTGHKIADGDREEHLVARLYRSAHTSDGCVSLGGEPIWLLGYQWPNQGGVKEKSRRADLVGMTRDGGLVVFEAKRADGEAPLVALLEGLDYLACLLRPNNCKKIDAGFRRWIERRNVPSGFEGSIPDASSRPTLVVLAPDDYFSGRQARSTRGKDLPELAGVGDSFMNSVRVVFAATDFTSLELALHPEAG